MVALLPLLSLIAQPAEGEPNLALTAVASASESYGSLTPEKAIDGNGWSRWSGIPGHNDGVWFQLDWEAPVHIEEVVVRQYDTFVMEMDLQVWDAASDDWRTLRHLGEPGRKLGRTLIESVEPTETTRLRFGNITNGPSFVEVEAYARAQTRQPVIEMASDLRGGIVGVVTDGWGSAPAAGATVALTAESAGGAWSATAICDDNGAFTVEAPLGLRGTVRAETTVGGTHAVREAPAAGFQGGLTAPGARTDEQCLDGAWRFAPDPPEGFELPGFDDSAWASIAVPSHWTLQGFASLEGIGGYRRVFRAPEGKGRVRLRFEGVYSGAEVWVNGTLVALHEGGFTPFEADVTEALREGSNLLAVRVREHTPVSDEMDKMSQYADFPLAGIFRSAMLFRVPQSRLAAVEVETEVEGVSGPALLRVRASIANERDEALDGAAFQLALLDAHGQAVPLPEASAPVAATGWGRAEAEAEVTVPDPLRWDAEHPNLYTLEARLTRGSHTVHRWVERIGFRQVRVEGPEILINGSPVRFRGTCHHDSHPVLGRAVTEALTRQDLEMMKAANLNAVRASHYPPHPSLPAIADELGLWLEDEASFCWVGVSDDLRLAPRILQLTAELLARDRNHPSVFMWSLCNESQFGRGFQRSHEWVRKVDPTRPTAAAISEWLEIATLHNPMALPRIEENEGLDQPLLFDESLAPFQGIWGDRLELWVDPGVRDYYADALRAVWQRALTSRATQGSFIWAWSDDIFQVPGRGLEVGRGAQTAHLITDCYRVEGKGLVGDAAWGVVDGWRRPKPEYQAIRRIYCPIVIPEAPLARPEPGAPLRVPVANWHDFTDLSELRIAWRLGDAAGVLEGVRLAPRTRGELLIAVPEPPRAGEVLELTVSDANGRCILEQRLPIDRERVAPPPVAERPAPAPLRIIEEGTLSGSFLRIVGSDFEIAVERGTGVWKRCVAFGRAVVTEGPSLRLVSGADPRRAVPSPGEWQPTDCRVERAGDKVRIVAEGSYPGLSGSYETLISPEGEVTVSARFDYSGEEVTLRGVGLQLAAPREMDTLRWCRDAEWSVYPDDQIGRPLGCARAEAPHRASEGAPTWPWSEDPSPLGSNDFRSTKRSIRWAGLSYAEGTGLLLRSDGTQSVRATREADRTTLLVTDFFEGTSAGLWEWVLNYGEGRELVPGTRIETMARFELVTFTLPEEEPPRVETRYPAPRQPMRRPDGYRS